MSIEWDTDAQSLYIAKAQGPRPLVYPWMSMRTPLLSTHISGPPAQTRPHEPRDSQQRGVRTDTGAQTGGRDPPSPRSPALLHPDTQTVRTAHCAIPLYSVLFCTILYRSILYCTGDTAQCSVHYTPTPRHPQWQE